MTYLIISVAAVASLVVLPYSALFPKDLETLVSLVDESLLSRISLALHIPSANQGAAVWLAIGGWSKLPHLIAQVRLLCRISIEAAKDKDAKRTEVERIRDSFGQDLRMACLEALLSPSRCVRVNAIRMGKSVVVLARVYASALEAVDFRTGDAVS
jgi:hypothetical protein